MFWFYIFIIVIVYLLYKGFTEDSSDVLNTPPYSRNRSNQLSQNQFSQPSQRRQDRTRGSLVDSAKRQEKMGNYDEASRLYLQGGQIFSAAKMKAMKGPHEAGNAVNIIEAHSPDKMELITQNLVNEFYYRLEKPATAASLLRNIGKEEEAVAVEVAAGISPTVTNSNVNTTPARSETTRTTSEINATSQDIPDMEDLFDEDTVAEDADINELLDEIAPLEELDVEPTVVETPEDPAGEYPNTLMMASTTLDATCSACRRDIESGDSFLYCLNCGRPGHYKHLGEIMKVMRKCPACKQKLVPQMYDL